MEKKTLALVAAFSIFLTSLVLLQSQKEASHLRQSPPETVPYVDINLYLGTWY